MGKRDQSTGSCKIAFIACSKTKKRAPCSAREMYQGALFKKAMEYCQKNNFNMTFILSAKYGLLELNDHIEPYEKTLNKMNKQERLKWADKINAHLKRLKGQFYFFTGENYHKHFEGIKPLQGLSLGNQLRWFNQQKKKAGFNL